MCSSFAHSSFPTNPQLVLLFFLGHCQSHRRPLFPLTLARTNLNRKNIVHSSLFPMSLLVLSIPFCTLHLQPMLLGLLKNASGYILDPQKQCIFKGINTGAALILESPSNIAPITMSTTLNARLQLRISSIEQDRTQTMIKLFSVSYFFLGRLITNKITIIYCS